jgi:hypothetical protein
MGSREQHAVDLRLVTAFDRWDFELFTFEVLLHDKLTLVQVSEEVWMR